MAKVVSAFRGLIGLIGLSWRLVWGLGLRRQRMIFFLQVGLVTCSVAGTVLLLSLSQAFRGAITERLYQYMGRFWVRYYGEEQESRPLPLEKPFLAKLESMGGVVVVPAIHLPVLIESAARRYEGITVLAVAPSWWQKTAWKALLTEQGLPLEGDSVIVLSQTLARRLGVRIGDPVTLLWLGNEHPRLRRLHVAALYQAHLEEIDRQVGFVALSMGQALLGWDSTQVQVGHLFVSGGGSVDSLAEAWSTNLPVFYEMLPIESLYPDIFDWLGLIEQNLQVILGIVLALAFFSVASAFLVLQFAQRLRYEIAWALGARPLQLLSITLGQAVFSVGVGVLLGEGIAALLLAGQERWAWVQLDAENYLLSVLPISWEGRPFYTVAGVALGLAAVLSFLAYPRKRHVRLLSQAE